MLAGKTAHRDISTNIIASHMRIEKVIHSIDPGHLLFIDGNTYSMDFTHFSAEPLPNSVHTCHDYSFFGFSRGLTYTDTAEEKAKLRSSFELKVNYIRVANGPIYLCTTVNSALCTPPQTRTACLPSKRTSHASHCLMNRLPYTPRHMCSGVSGHTRTSTTKAWCTWTPHHRT